MLHELRHWAGSLPEVCLQGCCGYKPRHIASKALPVGIDTPVQDKLSILPVLGTAFWEARRCSFG